MSVSSYVRLPCPLEEGMARPEEGCLWIHRAA
jgi:hypothetical protein